MNNILHVGTGIVAQAAPQQGSPLLQMLFFMSFIFMMYFFIYVRPVTKEKEQHQNMVNGLIKGDKVVSIGGIHGEIVEVQEHTVLLNVGRNSFCTIGKSAIKAKITAQEATGEKNA